MFDFLAHIFNIKEQDAAAKYVLSVVKDLAEGRKKVVKKVEYDRHGTVLGHSYSVEKVD